MTLIIGIKCSDGIVVGADGAATFGSFGQRTISQSVSKLDIIDEKVILGVSGSVGLGQRINGQLSKMWISGDFQKKRGWEAMTMIRKAVWNEHQGTEMQVASLARNVVGPSAADSAIAAAVVAMALEDSPTLFEFDGQGAPEEKTKDIPFVAIGSGQSTADPFLAFLRRIFWPSKLPTLEDGKLAVQWTLQHAIQTTPGGIGPPVELAVLERPNKKWVARKLGDSELDEHRQAIAAAETRLAGFREAIADPSSDGAEDPPPSPDEDE